MHGELEQIGGAWQLRFTRSLRHPPERVWRALTDATELEAWFPTTIEGELVTGASLKFGFRDEPYDPLDGVMLACEPNRLMEFRWGDDLLRITLEPDGAGTRLTLVDVLSDIGKGARDAAGWHVCLDNLERWLAGEPTGEGNEWEPLNLEYASRFGPEAATLGPPEPVRR
jgi:uncharacterized protein YndB with AHSA1/START domain